jgi:hypothetical protein
MMLTHFNRSRTPAFLGRWTEYFMIAALAILLLSLGLLIAGCAGGIPGNVLSSSDTQAVQNFIRKAAVSTQLAMDRSYNDFAAATPQFTDGMACVGSHPDPTKPIDNVGMTNLGTGVRSVLDAIQRELAANPPGTGTSAIEAVAKASIYNPGSAQFQWVIKTVMTACTNYGIDVKQAVDTTVGMFNSAALAGILAGAPLAAEGPKHHHYALMVE